MVFTEKFAGWSNCFGKWHLFTDNTKSPQIGAINFFNLGLSGSGLLEQFSFRFLMGLAWFIHSAIGWFFSTGFGFFLQDWTWFSGLLVVGFWKGWIWFSFGFERLVCYSVLSDTKMQSISSVHRPVSINWLIVSANGKFLSISSKNQSWFFYEHML